MSMILRSWSCFRMKKVHPWFLIVVILTFVVVSLPFVQCSTSTRIYRTNMAVAESRSITTSILVKAQEVARFRNIEASVGRGVEDSTRLVPTGPDPLHHNDHPLDP